jgi:predicted Ser/Thr protein kinase
MDNNSKKPSFQYIGDKRWLSDKMLWSESEMITLYFVLGEALKNTESSDERHEIVYLMEKIFRLTETIEINDCGIEKGI